MADLPPYPGAPRWVKVAAIIVGVVALLVVVLIVAGGRHGPGRHFQTNSNAPARGKPGTPDHKPSETRHR